MKINQVAIGKVRPYPGNPRQNDQAVEKVAASIQEFGWRQPLVVDEDFVLIVGHTRLKAAEYLGLQKVPVHVARDLSPEKARAYRLMDNRSHEDATWDDELLASELQDLQGLDFELSLTGFEDNELDRLLAGGAGLTDPDDAPPVPKKPKAKPGDLFVLGAHRLLCGDSTDEAAVQRLLAGEKPHLMVTDPPYGVNYDPAWRVTTPGGARGKVLNDDRADWSDAWALFPGHVAYVWHGSMHTPVVLESLATYRFRPRAQIVWVKTRPVMSRGHYHWQHETCSYTSQDGRKDRWQFIAEHDLAEYLVLDGETAEWNGDRKQSTVWFIEHLKNDTGHGTQKPVECMRRPIVNNSRRGDAVYEPFSGSGSTIIAAEMTGRRCFAMELAPEYVDVAVQRWEEFTGNKAVLEKAPAAKAKKPAPKRRTRARSKAANGAAE